MTKKENPEREQFKRALAGLIGGRVVAYYPMLARRIGGVKAAVMLSQLIYWMSDKTVRDRPGHWIFKTVDEMEEETGLNKVEQHTARRLLMRSGVIVAELRGVPRIWRYRVNMDRLGDILLGLGDKDKSHWDTFSSNEKVIERDCHSMTDIPNVGGQTAPMLDEFPSQFKEESEITKENQITSEITTTTTTPASPAKMVVVVWEDAAADLAAMGIWEPSIPDFILHAQAHGWAEDQLIRLIKRLRDKYDPDRACSLLRHRIESENPSSYIGYAHSPRQGEPSPDWHLPESVLDQLEQAGLTVADLDELDAIAAAQGWSGEVVLAMLGRYISAMDLLTDARNDPRSMRR